MLKTARRRVVASAASAASAASCVHFVLSLALTHSSFSKKRFAELIYHSMKKSFCKGRKMKSYSRSNLDLLSQKWFDKIGTTNKIAVEFGAADGWEYSNIRMFESLGWSLIQFDLVASNDVHQEAINQENINDIFSKYKIPPEFDLLSIGMESVKSQSKNGNH